MLIYGLQMNFAHKDFPCQETASLSVHFPRIPNFPSLAFFSLFKIQNLKQKRQLQLRFFCVCVCAQKPFPLGTWVSRGEQKREKDILHSTATLCYVLPLLAYLPAVTKRKKNAEKIKRTFTFNERKCYLSSAVRFSTFFAAFFPASEASLLGSFFLCSSQQCWASLFFYSFFHSSAGALDRFVGFTFHC